MARPDPAPAGGRIPVLILAGFLGAGKTTLLNRLLGQEHGRRLAILVNDFGEINIDAQLVEAGDGSDIISLANGCICCTMWTGMVSALTRLLRLPIPPERIVIEASGVSSPANIVSSLELPELAPYLAVDAVITLVDAERVRLLAPIVTFLEDQIRSADLVILNKMDLVGAEEAVELRTWLHETAPRARIVPTTFAQIPLGFLLSDAAGLGRQAGPAAQLGEPHQDVHFVTWTFRSDRPLSRAALEAALEGLPSEIYRVKGIVYLAECPGSRTVLQGVGKRIRLEEAGPWDTPAQTQIVLIGAPGSVDATALRSIFESTEEQ